VLKSIEQEIGRQSGPRWGPRILDLDLLLYGNQTIDEPALTVPHAELTNRAFVLVPLLEIDPDLELPSGEPLSAFCEKDPPGVRLFAPPKELLGSAIAGDG
jgi:2-amino-4-hydroxy-6-hydroxymethyldihydropteridine diphosphokinase